MKKKEPPQKYREGSREQKKQVLKVSRILLPSGRKTDAVAAAAVPIVGDVEAAGRDVADADVVTIRAESARAHILVLEQTFAC